MGVHRMDVVSESGPGPGSSTGRQAAGGQAVVLGLALLAAVVLTLAVVVPPLEVP